MDEWISVKDKLPDHANEVVLAVCFGKVKNITFEGAIEFAYYHKNRKDIKWFLDEYQNENYEDIQIEVTHWMPVPKLPEDIDELVFEWRKKHG